MLVGGWRLPKVADTGVPGCDAWSYAGGTECGYNADPASSEMAHLYLHYVTLCNLSYCPPGNATCTGGGVPRPGWGLTNTGAFQSLQPDRYWSGTAYAPFPFIAWHFATCDGLPYALGSGNGLYAMAVRPGDVAGVPEPQSCAMLLLGLSAVTVAARRRPR